MDVLILGAGFLGTILSSALISNGHDVTLFNKATLDYTDQNTLFDYIKYSNFGLVINASGYTGRPNIDACEDDKDNCWKYNVEVPAKIMRVCNKFNLGMVHLSSGCIYAGYDREYTESDIPNFGLFNEESSFYSKTKHAAETILQDNDAWIFRIRMPFSGEVVDRNYFNKILKYDSLISEYNSMTCVEDLCDFVNKFILKKDQVPYGIYNVVNCGYVSAKEIVKMLRERDVMNPYHHFISTDKLKTKAKRSNCIISTNKIQSYDLTLPYVKLSLEKCIDRYAASVLEL